MRANPFSSPVKNQITNDLIGSSPNINYNDPYTNISLIDYK